MAKMENLTVIEEAMFEFLRKNFYVPPSKLQPEFEAFLLTIRQFEKNRFQTRSFAYLDIISWVESKVNRQPMSTNIRNKYLRAKRSRILQNNLPQHPIIY